MQHTPCQETFLFEVDDDGAVGKGDLVIEIRDEDKISKDDTKGMVRIREADIVQMWRDGSNVERAYNILSLKDGSQVMGNDKKPSTLTLAISAVMPRGQSEAAAIPTTPVPPKVDKPLKQEPQEPKKVATPDQQLRVTVVKASSLPKADLVSCKSPCWYLLWLWTRFDWPKAQASTRPGILIHFCLLRCS